MIRNSYTIRAIATLGIVIGVLLFLQPVINFVLQHASFIHLPRNPLYLLSSVIISPILGILFLYTSLFLYKRRQIAFILSEILAIFTLGVILYERRPLAILIVLLVVFIVWLFLYRRLYTVKSDLLSIRFGILTSLAIAGIALLYGTLGIFIFGPRVFHQHFDIVTAGIIAFKIIFTLNEPLQAPNRAAELLTNSLDILGVIAYAAAATSLFKPVRFVLGSTTADRLQAEHIIRHHSRSSEDFFKIWPHDKHYFFSPSRQSFIAYRCSGRTALILGGPSGQPNEFAALHTSFLNFVHANSWSVAAINLTPSSEKFYSTKRFKRLFIGNEAVIVIKDFMDKTINSKHFRYVRNRAKREGLTIEYWENPHGDQIHALQSVSNSWLSQNGRKEYGFFNGYFDPAYLEQCQIMVVKQQGKVVAYCNSIPVYKKSEASIDHFRSSVDASPIAVHYLLMQFIKTLYDNGKAHLNLGLAPLSGIEDVSDTQPLPHRLLRLLKRLGNRFYSFDGVEQFKGKFKPIWHPQYLLYEGGPAALLYVARDVDAISQGQDNWLRIKYILFTAFALLTIILVQFI